MDSIGGVGKRLHTFSKCHVTWFLHNGALLVAFLSHGLVGFEVVKLHGVDCAASVKVYIEVSLRIKKNSLELCRVGQGSNKKTTVHDQKKRTLYLLSRMKVTAEIASMPYSIRAIATKTGALWKDPIKV